MAQQGTKFKCVQMKGPALFFQGERIMKHRQYTEEPSPSSQESMRQFQPWVYGIQICSNEGPGSFPGEVIN